jgi:hypothetical protein
MASSSKLVDPRTHILMFYDLEKAASASRMRSTSSFGLLSIGE